MEAVRVGVIGVGNMGGAHARYIFQEKAEGLRLAALCDCDPERCAVLRAVYPEVPVFSDHRSLLQSGLTDGVVIATPHKEHPPIAVDAFRAGQHVLTEKPAGVSTRAVREMNAAARDSGRVFAIMFNQRTDPLYARAREIVQSGKLGEPKRLNWMITNWYRTQAYYDSGDWRATWNGEGGGVLLNQAPHNLDLWQWIFGMPKRLRAFCQEGKWHRIGVEDEATLYAEYENGATAVFITTTGEAPGTNRLEISGDRGKLTLEEGRLRWWRLEQPERELCFQSKDCWLKPKAHLEEFTASGVDGHGEILRNFARAILWGEPLLAPGEEGIRSLMLSNGAYLSSWTDDWVELPVDEERFEALLRRRQAEETARKTTIRREAPPEEYNQRWRVQW